MWSSSATDWTFDRSTIEGFAAGQTAVYGLVRAPLRILMPGKQSALCQGEHILIGTTTDLRVTLLDHYLHPDKCLVAWRPNVIRVEVPVGFPVDLRARALISTFGPACNAGRMPKLA
jgi:hypothetical protein